MTDMQSDYELVVEYHPNFHVPRANLKESVEDAGWLVSEMEQVVADIKADIDSKEISDMLHTEEGGISEKIQKLVYLSSAMGVRLTRTDFCIHEETTTNSLHDLFKSNAVGCIAAGAAVVASMLGLLIKNDVFSLDNDFELDKIIGDPKNLLPWYLMFMVGFAASSFTLCVFGPPDVAAVGGAPKDGKMSIARVVTFALQLLSLFSFSMNMFSTIGAQVQSTIYSANNSAGSLTWLLKSFGRSATIFALSPMWSDIAKMKGLWCLCMYNMKFIRAHDPKFYEYVFLKDDVNNTYVERTFYNAKKTLPGTATPWRKSTFCEWLFHPQGLMAHKGGVVAVQYSLFCFWFLPFTGSWFIGFAILLSVAAYWWISAAILIIWYLIMDNVVMPMVWKLSRRNVDIDLKHPVFDCLLTPKQDRAAKLDLMAKLRPTNSVAEWLLNVGRGGMIGFFVGGNRLPRFAWCFEEGKLTPLEAYDQDMKWFKATGITYHSWNLFFLLSVLCPALVSALVISCMRFLSSDLSFSAYFGAIWQTIGERHWITYWTHVVNGAHSFVEGTGIFQIVRRLF